MHTLRSAMVLHARSVLVCRMHAPSSFHADHIIKVMSELEAGTGPHKLESFVCTTRLPVA